MNMIPAPLYSNTSSTALTVRFRTATTSASKASWRNRCRLDRSASSSMWTMPGRLPGQSAVGGARVQFRGPPAVPGRHRPVRPEPVAERLELPGGRRRDLPGQPIAAADAEVADRPDVQAAQLEEQEHLGRPGPDAAHLRQPRDDL